MRMFLKNPYKPGGMFEGASHLIFENTKNLRGDMTAAEMNLWVKLRKSVNGFKFRRQHPIGIYIADFYCHKAKLIIELDGSIHNIEEVIKNDEERQKELERWGYFVIRSTNKQIMQNQKKLLKLLLK